MVDPKSVLKKSLVSIGITIFGLLTSVRSLLISSLHTSRLSWQDAKYKGVRPNCNTIQRYRCFRQKCKHYLENPITHQICAEIL